MSPAHGVGAIRASFFIIAVRILDFDQSQVSSDETLVSYL